LSRPALEPLLDGTSFNFSQQSELAIKVKRPSVVEPVSVVTQDLSFEYTSENVKSKKLIHNLNLQLAPGKLLVLWGRSGSGKTTLLDILAGLRKPTCGIIRFENIRGESVDNIAKSYVGQEPFLSKGKLTESLLLGLEVEDDSLSELKRILSALNLEGAIDNLDSFELLENSTNISGGEKQRLSIARALTIPSSIVFMDEPTSALDQKNHDSVIKLIKSQIGIKTMIIATHDQQIKFLADEVISLGDRK
jgi:ABC-type transport system involved in cytochrome bd biosynthesis fused ATPase/permease subunit